MRLEKITAEWMSLSVLVWGLVGSATAGDELAASHQRAGCPRMVSCLAGPAVNGRFNGYYVGGNCKRGGNGPSAEQGTWGWDFFGFRPVRKVVLGWPANSEEKSGERALKRNTGYKSDTPEVPVPKPIRKL